MATRAPTTFNQHIDHKQFQPNKIVLPTEVDKVFDDQEYLLIKMEQVFSVYLGRLVVGNAGWTDVCRIPCKIPDRCDIDANDQTCLFRAQLRLPTDISGTGDTYEIKCESDDTADTVTLTADGSEPTVLPGSLFVSGEVDFSAHGADDVAIITARVTNATNLYINAIQLVAKSV